MTTSTGANVVVILVMAVLLIICLPFCFGIIILLTVQTCNLLTGLTTLERLGSRANRPNQTVEDNDVVRMKNNNET